MGGLPLSVDDQDNLIDLRHAVTWKVQGGNWGNVFGIRRSTGQFYVAVKALDHEIDEFYTLAVAATDNGSPPLEDYAKISIHVTDINEPPSIERGKVFKIIECSDCSKGQLIGTISAHDYDNPAENFGILEFSLVLVERGFLDYKDDEAKTVWRGPEENTDRFAVSTRISRGANGAVVSYTGELRYGSVKFDRESQSNIFRSTIRVTDSPYSVEKERLHSTTTVEIRLSEMYAYVGPRLIDHTTEPDIFSRQKHAFSIESGNEDELWAIEECTGQLTLVKPMNEAGSRLH